MCNTSINQFEFAQSNSGATQQEPNKLHNCNNATEHDPPIETVFNHQHQFLSHELPRSYHTMVSKHQSQSPICELPRSRHNMVSKHQDHSLYHNIDNHSIKYDAGTIQPDPMLFTNQNMTTIVLPKLHQVALQPLLYRSLYILLTYIFRGIFLGSNCASTCLCT